MIGGVAVASGRSLVLGLPSPCLIIIFFTQWQSPCVKGGVSFEDQNAKAASEAQAAMADHRHSSDSATTDRMRDGRF